MKKLYSKPSVIFMELRPEERLAGLCDWNIGVGQGDVPSCRSSIYSDYPEVVRYLCRLNTLVETMS